MIQEAASEAQRFCFRFVNNDRNSSMLVLAGHTGCGKTKIMTFMHTYCNAAAWQAYHRNKGENGWRGHSSIPAVHFASWPRVTSEILNKCEGSLLDLLEVDCLFLDDIGAENSAFGIASDKLCQVLSRRERRFTVITTNISPEDWNTRFDVRIADRLLRNSVVVDMTDVPSYSVHKLTR